MLLDPEERISILKTRVWIQFWTDLSLSFKNQKRCHDMFVLSHFFMICPTFLPVCNRCYGNEWSNDSRAFGMMSNHRFGVHVEIITLLDRKFAFLNTNCIVKQLPTVIYPYYWRTTFRNAIQLVQRLYYMTGHRGTSIVTLLNVIKTYHPMCSNGFFSNWVNIFYSQDTVHFRSAHLLPYGKVDEVIKKANR